MSAMTVIRVEVSENYADQGRLDELTRNLLRELRGGGLDVERPTTVVPDGAKSGAGLTTGALIVGLIGSGGVGNLVSGIFAWLSRSHDRSVKLVDGDRAIELSDISAPEQRRLLADWLDGPR